MLGMFIMNNKVRYLHMQMEHNPYMEIQIIMYLKVIQVMHNWHGTSTPMEK